MNANDGRRAILVPSGMQGRRPVVPIPSSVKPSYLIDNKGNKFVAAPVEYLHKVPFPRNKSLLKLPNGRYEDSSALGKVLLQAAKENKINEVKGCMAQGAPLSTDALGFTAIHFAAMNGNYQMTWQLIKFGAMVDGQNKVGRTPLHYAVDYQHFDVTNLLLHHGADVNVTCMLKMSPLHWAIERQSADLVALLLQHGANLKLVNKFLETPAITAQRKKFDLTKQVMLKRTFLPPPNIMPTKPVKLQVHPRPPLMQSLPVKSMMAKSNVKPSSSQEVASSINSSEFEEATVLVEEILPSKSGNLLPMKSKTDEIVICDQPVATSSKMNKVKQVQARGAEMIRKLGIAPIPEDNTTLVASALDSGQSVSLTEAGKLALNAMKQNEANPSSTRKPIRAFRRCTPVNGTTQLVPGQYVQVNEKQLLELSRRNGSKPIMAIPILLPKNKDDTPVIDNRIVSTAAIDNRVTPPKPVGTTIAPSGHPRVKILPGKFDSPINKEPPLKRLRAAMTNKEPQVPAKVALPTPKESEKTAPERTKAADMFNGFDDVFNWLGNNVLGEIAAEAGII